MAGDTMPSDNTQVSFEDAIKFWEGGKRVAKEAYSVRSTTAILNELDAALEALRGVYALLPDSIAYMPADQLIDRHKNAKGVHIRYGDAAP